MFIILSLIVTAVIIGLLVFIHELGHFFVAKKLGIVVEEFAFGFGPKIFAKKLNGTEYRLNLIPLGGYVKMLGDQDGSSLTKITKEIYPEEDKEYALGVLKENGLDPVYSNYTKVIDTLRTKQTELQPEYASKIENFIVYDLVPNHPSNYENKPISFRIAVVTAGVIMNFILGVLLFYAMFAASDFKTVVPKIGESKVLGAEVYDKLPILYAVYGQEEVPVSVITYVDGKPFTAEKFSEILENNKNKKLNLTLFDFEQAKLVERQLILNGDGIKSSLDESIQGKVFLTEVVAGSAAEKADLSFGDIIVTFNKKQVTSVEQLLKLRDRNAGKTIEVGFINLEGELKITSLEVPMAEEGKEPLIGAGLAEYDLEYLDNLLVLDYSNNPLLSGFTHSINTLNLNFSGLAELVKQSIAQKSIAPVSQGVGSIVAVTDFTYSLVRVSDFISILNLTASLSIVLAIMNILPIPLLDGGHIVFLVYEKIKGRPVSPEKLEKISKISFAILIILSVLLIVKDIFQFDWPSRIFDLVKSIFIREIE